jgi:hypothetical protein
MASRVQSLFFVVILLTPTGTMGDAIIRSQAMLAGTIAEYFIEPARWVLELEIGRGDLAAFANLMPTPCTASSTFPRHRSARERFLAEDLPIRADDRPPLGGRVLEMHPRARVHRDEVTPHASKGGSALALPSIPPALPPIGGKV